MPGAEEECAENQSVISIEEVDAHERHWNLAGQLPSRLEPGLVEAGRGNGDLGFVVELRSVVLAKFDAVEIAIIIGIPLLRVPRHFEDGPDLAHKSYNI